MNNLFALLRQGQREITKSVRLPEVFVTVAVVVLVQLSSFIFIEECLYLVCDQA